MDGGEVAGVDDVLHEIVRMAAEAVLQLRAAGEAVLVEHCGFPAGWRVIGVVPDPQQPGEFAQRQHVQRGTGRCAVCLEVALNWRKSTYSDGEGGACVEIAPCTPTTTVHIRDSKLPAETGPHLTVPASAWSAFLATEW